MNRRKLSILAVVTIFVLGVLVVNAEEIMGADCVRKLSGSSVKTEATTWVDVWKYPVAWGTTTGYVYVGTTIRAGITKPWDDFMSYQRVTTSSVILSNNDVYYGEGYHAVGTSFEYVTDTAESDYGPYTYASKSSSLLQSTDHTVNSLYEEIKSIGDRVAVDFDLVTDKLVYCNILDKLGDKELFENNYLLDKSFRTSYFALLSQAEIGDKVPSIWIDYASKTVYMGWEKANGKSILHTLKWESTLNDTQESIEWELINSLTK